MTELLDFLVTREKVDYMSDLRLTPHLKSIIKDIEPSYFPLKDWNQTIQYLCKNNVSFHTEIEAKQYLINDAQ